MSAKYLTAFLILLLFNSGGNFQLLAQTTDDKEAARITRLKADISALGLGQTAPVEIKLKNGRKLRGYVSDMKVDTIVFAETAMAQTHDLSYAEVRSIKAYRPKNTARVWTFIAIGVGLAAAIAIGIKVCKDREKRGETCSDGSEE